MQTIPLRNICVIREMNRSVNGYPTCLALLKKTLNSSSNLNVYSLLFIHLRKELPELLNNNSRFHVLECLDDIGSLTEIRKRCNAQNINKNSLIFIDSLNSLIEQYSLHSTSWLLNQLSELCACVLALIGGEIMDDEWRRIESLSTTIFQLQLNDETNQHQQITLCNVKTRKTNQSFEIKIEPFEILSDYSIKISEYVKPDRDIQILQKVQKELSLQHYQQQDNSEKFAFDKLTFDIGLNLSEQEQKAKAGVQLPYIRAQCEKGLVGMNISTGKKVRAGGQIIYTPDMEDDFDESDPDDDLAI